MNAFQYASTFLPRTSLNTEPRRAALADAKSEDWSHGGLTAYDGIGVIAAITQRKVLSLSSFTIAVYGGPDSPSHVSAQQFVTAALAADHRIERIFLYQDAVVAADRTSVPPPPALAGWIELQRHFRVSLTLCVGAASRRGLIDEADPTNTERIDPHFEVVGLGQLIDAIVRSDRFVTFAA